MPPALLWRAQTSQQKQWWKHRLNKIFTTAGTQTWCKLTYCVSFFSFRNVFDSFLFLFWKEPSSTTYCLCSLHFPTTIVCNLVARYIIRVDKRGVSLSTSDVSGWQLPQHPKKNKNYVGGFVASWNQLAVDVLEGFWDNEPVRDSVWPPSQPSVNEQTSHWTCYRWPSEVTSNSQRSSFTWRTVRLA